MNRIHLKTNETREVVAKNVAREHPPGIDGRGRGPPARGH